MIQKEPLWWLTYRVYLLFQYGSLVLHLFGVFGSIFKICSSSIAAKDIQYQVMHVTAGVGPSFLTNHGSFFFCESPGAFRRNFQFDMFF